MSLQILEKGSPYPLIILPQFGGYWIEDPENLGTPTSSDSSICEEEEENLSPSPFGYKLECKGEARAYRKHFLGKVGSSLTALCTPLTKKTLWASFTISLFARHGFPAWQ